MAEDSTRTLYYPSLVGGVRSSAPPRTLSPDGSYAWRDALNVVERDGRVIGRPAVRTVASVVATPTIAGVDTVEVPRYVNVSTAADGSYTVVLVTDRQAYVRVGSSGTWTNITPTYATGTISATNGSPNIAGASTVWQDRGIDGAYWNDGGTFYYVTVTGNGAATIQPNYAGATGAGKAYTFIRRFGAGEHTFRKVDSELFATVYNGALYVSGTRVTKGTGVVSPGAVKVADVFTAPVVTYLTATTEVSVGVDFIAGLSRICGLATLQDGRVVFAGNANEVFYSSHLNDAVWTVAPGGVTPLAEVDDLIRAQGKMGSTRTFHHAGGIVFGYPTGLSDPPLRFESSTAAQGCVAPLTLTPYLGGEAFLAPDGDCKLFDGNTCHSLGSGEMHVRTVPLSFGADDYSRYFAWVFAGRDEYTLFRGNHDNPTKFWIYQPRAGEAGSWWPCETTVEVGAASALPEGTSSAATQGILGRASDSADSISMLATVEEGQADSVGTPTYMLETDDLDLGLPTTLKTPQRAAVWPVATMDDLVVGVRRSDDTTYVSATADPLSTSRPKWFDFEPGQVSGSIAADNAHRWKLSGATLRLGLFALLLRCKVGGEKETVTTG